MAPEKKIKRGKGNCIKNKRKCIKSLFLQKMLSKTHKLFFVEVFEIYIHIRGGFRGGGSRPSAPNTK